MSQSAELSFIKNKLIELEKKTNALIYANIRQNQKNKTIDTAKLQLFTEKLQQLEEILDSFPQVLSFGPIFESISGTSNAQHATSIIKNFTGDGYNLISLIRTLKTSSDKNQKTLDQLVAAHNNLIQALISGTYRSTDSGYTVTPEQFSNSASGKNSVLGSVLASNSDGSSLLAPKTITLNSSYQTTPDNPYSKIINSYITTDDDNILKHFQQTP